MKKVYMASTLFQFLFRYRIYTNIVPPILAKAICLSFAFTLIASFQIKAQSYESLGGGDWTQRGVWKNTSGWGAVEPTINGGNGTLTISHDIVVNGNLDLGGFGLNILSGGSLTVYGNLSGDWATFDVNGGGITVTGNLTKRGNININNGNINIGGYVNGPSNITVNGGSVDVGTYLSNLQNLTVNNGNLTVPGNFTGVSNLTLSNGSGTFGGATTTFGNPNFTDYEINVNGNVALSGSMNMNGGNLDIGGDFSGGGIIQVSNVDFKVEGDFTRSGGAHVTVGDNSTFQVGGDITLDARLQINRGAYGKIAGSVTVNSAEYLIIAQNNQWENPSEYADLVIQGSLINDGSGDISVNYHGRLAVHGNLVDSSDGGTFLRLREGSQIYVHGDIEFTGGGGTIQNEENANSPFGLYVNGSIENTNGVTNPNNLKTFTVNGVDVTVPCYNQASCTLPNGTTSNVGSQQVMIDSNEDFAEWVQKELGLSLITPQPVNLLFFKAQAQQQSVEINWASSKAWDFSHYELERSADGKVFKYVASIDAEELSNELVEYSYSDRQPILGTSYYRLKAVDIDGAFEYKEVAVVKFGAESFSVFPNPSESGFLHISWSHATEGAMLSLRDQAGRTVRSTKMSGDTISVSTEGMAPGIYLVSIQSPAGIQQSRVLVK